MKKRKNIAIPMILAATIAAVSVPCSSQIVMASDTYQVGVSKGYLALRSAMAYDSSNEFQQSGTILPECGWRQELSYRTLCSEISIDFGFPQCQRDRAR